MKKILLVLSAIFFAFPAMACTSGEIDVLGDGTQCETAHFTLTTSSTDSFQFKISAVGTFYVDCGDGGTLQGTSASGKTITRNNTTEATYTCSWGSAGAQTIGFAGTATNYNTESETAAISFFTDTTNAQKVNSISGNLSTMFPYISGNAADGAQPRFHLTFNNCTGLTSIPETLFANYTTGATYMFSNTFAGCRGLTSIPANLFANIKTGAAMLFRSTFRRCAGLTSIPENLFFPNISSVSGGLAYMFANTFAECTGLTSIPANLFAKVKSSVFGVFNGTFANCTGLTSIPENLFFPNASSVSGVGHLFKLTFQNCTGLTSIPANLFAKVTSGAEHMFYGTFSGCTGLTSIPENLFFPNATSVSGQLNMFTDTFYGCNKITSIPANLFAKVTTSAANMFQSTFRNCSGLTSIPESLFFPNATSVIGKNYMFSQTFQNCTGLTSIPANLFAKVTSGAVAMFNSTFKDCTGLASVPGNLFFPNATSVTGQGYMFSNTFSGCTGLTSIPENLFAKITTNADYMFQVTFNGCSTLASVGNTAYVPGTFLSGVGGTATGSTTDMFTGTALVASCPAGTYTATPSAYNNAGKPWCDSCAAGTYTNSAGQSSCSNVTAGYFCSGGCTTATPTSDEDCLTGNTCGQCLTDSVTGRPAYSGAGAASCSVCPAATQYASRVTSYRIYPNHTSIDKCFANFADSDDDATFSTFCYYSPTDADYGKNNSECYTKNPTACAAGKYDTLTSSAQWVEGTTMAGVCKGVDCMKGKVCTDTTAGYYSPDGAKTQTACALNSYSSAGASACTACPAGTFAPTGSAVCYPHRLHIGNDVVYVRSTKLTTPSLNIDIDNDGVADFFVNMTTTRTRMNKDSTHYFHAQWENNDYYICDDTTYVPDGE